MELLSSLNIKRSLLVISTNASKVYMEDKRHRIDSIIKGEEQSTDTDTIQL